MVTIEQNVPPAPILLDPAAGRRAPLGFDHADEACRARSAPPAQSGIRQLSALHRRSHDLTDSVELFATAIATDDDYEHAQHVRLFWNGVVAPTTSLPWSS